MERFNKYFLRGLISTGILDGGRGADAKQVAKNALQTATAMASAFSSVDSLKDKKFLKAAGLASAGALGVRLENKIGNEESNMNEMRPNGHMYAERPSEQGFFNKQFVVGALVGGAVTYIMMNPKVRAKVIKSVSELWEAVTSEIEDIKEQVADAQAELHSNKDEEVETKKAKSTRRSR